MNSVFSLYYLSSQISGALQTSPNPRAAGVAASLKVPLKGEDKSCIPLRVTEENHRDSDLKLY